MTDLKELALILQLALTEANQAIQQAISQGITADVKPDGSVVTNIDHISNDVISKVLAAHSSGIPQVSEECEHSWFIKDVPYHWLIDPIDGSNNLLKHNQEFVTIVALMQDQTPVIGGIGVPHNGDVNIGIVPLESAWKVNSVGQCSQIRGRSCSPQLTYVTSPRGVPPHDVGKDDHIIEISSGVKFLMLADGRAHNYGRFDMLRDWDVAGGAALVQAAGGQIHSWQGRPLEYGTPSREIVGFSAHSWH